MENVVDFASYKAKAEGKEFDQVEEMMVDFMKDSISILHMNGIDPHTEEIAKNIISISMLFRAVVDREFGNHNELIPMLDVMSKELENK